MLEQYKKTFLGVQVLALVVSAWVYFGLTHWWASTALVFVTMQIGGVFGPRWSVWHLDPRALEFAWLGSRLRQRRDRNEDQNGYCFRAH